MAERESATTDPGSAAMPEYAVVLTVSTDLPPHEDEQLAAELAEEAKAHLLPGEALVLRSVLATRQPAHRAGFRSTATGIRSDGVGATEAEVTAVCGKTSRS